MANAATRLLAERTEFSRALSADNDADPEYAAIRRAVNGFLSTKQAANDLVAICKAANPEGSPLQFASEHIRSVTSTSGTTCTWSSATEVDPSIPYLDQMSSEGSTKPWPPLLSTDQPPQDKDMTCGAVER